MKIHGTLHLYSGHRRELFFVFADSIAQLLYKNPAFDIENAASRAVSLSVGNSRFISERTLSFSRKQSEIKVSLCSHGSKEGLKDLTGLYNWFASQKRPPPFAVSGSLVKTQHGGRTVWELHLAQPSDVEMVVPPGLKRRRRSFAVTRRKIVERDLLAVGLEAERTALAIVSRRFPPPRYEALWRYPYLDSEKLEIRKHGIIADIDVWDSLLDAPVLSVEVKAQHIGKASKPIFYLSQSEYESFERARKAKIPYELWLIQYRDRAHLRPKHVRLLQLKTFNVVHRRWLIPETYVVTPA